MNIVLSILGIGRGTIPTHTICFEEKSKSLNKQVVPHIFLYSYCKINNKQLIFINFVID